MVEINLKSKLTDRKVELANSVQILQHLSSAPLRLILSEGEARGLLRGRLDAHEDEIALNAVDINALVVRLLEGINSLLGTNYNLAELRDGTIPVEVLTDSIKGAVRNKKLLIYKPFELGNLAGAASSTVELDVDLLAKLDSTSWANPLSGDYGAPFDAQNPVLVSGAYDDEIRVDLFYASDRLPVFDNAGKRIVGYASSYLGNEVTVAWGTLDNSGVFAAAAIPGTITSDLVATIPLKTTLHIMPVNGLAMARREGWNGIRQSDLDTINSILSGNGLSELSNLVDVIGSNITALDFAAATTHALVSTGYNSVSEAIVGILTQIQTATGDLALHLADDEDAHDASAISVLPVGNLVSVNAQAALEELQSNIDNVLVEIGQTVDLVDSLKDFVGQTSLEAMPTYNLFGDARDKVVQASSLETAISVLNTATYKKNIINVSSENGEYASINSAKTAIVAGAYGTPSSDNRFVIQVAPGSYVENISLDSWIQIKGAGVGVSVIDGTVSYPTDVVGAGISGVTVTATDNTVLIFGNTSNEKYYLSDIDIIATSGTALIVYATAEVVCADDVVINGQTLGVNVNGGMLVVGNSNLIGSQSVLVHNSGLFEVRGAKLVGGVTVDVGSFMFYSGSVDSNSVALSASQATLGLFGGRLAGAVYDIEQTGTTSTIMLGATSMNQAKVVIGTTNVIPMVGASGVSLKDTMGLYPGISNVEGALASLGNTSAVQNSLIADNEDRINENEADAIVESAIGLLSDLPVEYSFVMVDTFKTDLNEHVGADKVEIDTDKTILVHGDEGIPVTIYKQAFAGDMSNKSKVAFKVFLDDGIGGTDYAIDFNIIVSGGRYASGLIYNIKHYANPLPSQFNQHILEEVDLSVVAHDPAGNAPLTPIIGAGEIVTLQIKNTLDSNGSVATPSIRSFQVFM